MKKKLNLRDFAILQLVVLIYTSSTVISKIAAQSAESGKGWTFLLLYGAEIGVLGIYALCWQQVLLFGEQITVKKLIGVGLVLAGTLIINGGKEQENHD